MMKKIIIRIVVLCHLAVTVTAQTPSVSGKVDSTIIPENSVVLLVDRTNFILSGDYGQTTPESQQIVSVLEIGTDDFAYHIDLPTTPPGNGLRLFTIEIAQNYFGPATLHPLEQRFEQGTTTWQSIIVEESTPTVIGGTLIVFTPDDEQRFPTGFGDDGRLFTEDDPLGTLPVGYTTIHMHSNQFQWIQKVETVIELHPIPNLIPIDYSHLNFVSAFDALIATLQQRYAYTAFRNIDWQALQRAYQPRIIAAGTDPIAYYQTLSDMALEIGDLHVFAAPLPELVQLMNPGIDMTSSNMAMPSVIQVTFVDGYGIATLDHFTQPLETMAIWQDFLVAATQNNAPGIIIDLRNSRGGDGALATIMAGHLFSDENPLTFQNLLLSRYDIRMGQFATMPLANVQLYVPDEIPVFEADIIILTGPACISACELFTYLLQDRATIVGTTATAGAGGAMNVVTMPGYIHFYYTFMRATDVQGQPVWEQNGIFPEFVHDVSQIDPIELFALTAQE
ncbi:MAG: S41 family peptidase [Aggregatilineales bacterium]